MTNYLSRIAFLQFWCPWFNIRSAFDIKGCLWNVTDVHTCWHDCDSSLAVWYLWHLITVRFCHRTHSEVNHFVRWFFLRRFGRWNKNGCWCHHQLSIWWRGCRRLSWMHFYSHSCSQRRLFLAWYNSNLGLCFLNNVFSDAGDINDNGLLIRLITSQICVRKWSQTSLMVWTWNPKSVIEIKWVSLVL